MSETALASGLPGMRIERYCAVMATPFAAIGIQTEDDHLVAVHYLTPGTATMAPRNALAREACRQIEAYLHDPRHVFDLPCRARGSAFQQRVWAEIARIPSGTTRTYGELAQAIASSARPVGGACGSNPLPLVVACHRVVAAGGRLGGFMHSRSDLPLAIKRWLLQHETGR